MSRLRRDLRRVELMLERTPSDVDIDASLPLPSISAGSDGVWLSLIHI